jgi:RNA polymerase sigma-70 factor (ECF subfamily)
MYDRLVQFDGSPVVALNRAVAVANLRGPEAGIAAVKAIPNRPQLNGYYLLYAVLGDLEMRRRDFGPAAEHLRKALSFAELQSEKAFLAKQISACER